MFVVIPTISLVRNMACLYRQPNKYFINNNKRFLTTNSTTNSKVSNNKKNTPFQNLQKQPEAFQQSQPQPPKDNRRGKRAAKRSTVDLIDEDEDEEEQIRQCARWTRDEEILLTQCWIETSENGQIGADRTEDSFWGQIMDDFNSATTQGYRTRHMLTGKWTRINGDCQNSTAEGEKVSTRARVAYFKRSLPKWDAPTPLDTEDHIEIFGADVRPRPAGKNRPAKKTKFETMGSSGGSASGSIFDYVSEDLRRKLQAGTFAYEAKKAKEMAMIEFKEMEFLTIDVDSLSEPKASIIRNRQEKIIAKYTQR
ncbi:hypothetical protein Tco_0818301 [Tanacetum coccineum]